MSKTMGSCKFVNELNRLRKSSNDSIDNIESFDPFKVYMHVTRTAEEDLKNILRRVNASGKKNLILLCGSAGDGKSHLLSYLKNSDEENLLEGYTIYNDATESNSPSKTAIETLNELLDSFKDVNIELPGKNIILAINLGVLSNFIESEYGEAYWNLKAYVEKSNILTSKVNDNGYDSRSHFQHVSFSDYHMYSLTENGVHISFYEMESEITSETATMSQIETGASLGGILSGIPSSKYGHKYRTGFGGKYAEQNKLIELAMRYNSLMQVEKSGNPYYAGTSISTQIDEKAENKMDYIYKNSNWVVFVDPKVDLDFFSEKEAKSDLLIIHYSDQYTSSSGYDAITVIIFILFFKLINFYI